MNLWDEKTDIIIIGSGLAGLAAAIEAKQAGAAVMVFEKMKITGGNTRISDGALAAPCNYLQKKLKIDDSPQLFFDDMIRAGLGLNHPELVQILAQKASETIDWTRKELGVKYMDRLDRFGGHSAARSITTRSHSGKDIIKAQVEKLKTYGQQIRTRCLLKRLITDENNAVTGVEIQEGYLFPEKSTGKRKMIQARLGVILATGGFGNDVGFRSFLNPGLDESVKTTNQKGATAEGISAALKIEAFPVHLSWIQLGPWGCPDEKGYGTAGRFASYSVFPEGIMINPDTGFRIVNEWADRRQRSEAMMQTGRPCLGIVDDKGAQKDSESLKLCIKTGKVKAFENISDLGKAYAVPSEVLGKTIKNYNVLIEKGKPDEFGKPLIQSASKIETPPFYGIRLYPKVHFTAGGLGINKNAQVLDLSQNPIPGLYAAGEVCGGVHGASRLGSCALTECLVFGRIAGKQAAASLF